MVHVKILLLYLALGSERNENLIFHINFLNTHISLNIVNTALKFGIYDLCNVLEGSVSQILYLGPRFYFMLFRNLCLKNSQKVTRFFT